LKRDKKGARADVTQTTTTPKAQAAPVCKGTRSSVITRTAVLRLEAAAATLPELKQACW